MKTALRTMNSEIALNVPGAAALAGQLDPFYLRNDPIRRFLATPYCVRLNVMGRTIGLETNHAKILRHTTELLAHYPGSASGHPDFLWRIVVEDDAQLSPVWPRRTAFSGAGLRFVAFGQKNFLAVDLDARHAIGILSHALMDDDLGLTSPFLDNMFCLSAGSLGLTPIWANSVACKQRAILLFGCPGSGKTCTSYLAEKLGLDFHADEGVFIETDSANARCWGGFWPPAFRPGALEVYPELNNSTRAYRYRDLTLYHRTKQPARPVAHLPATAVCCLFLERDGSMVARLLDVPFQDRAKLLTEYRLFHDEERFLEQQTTAVRALANLPAYVLRYSDPHDAARKVQELLAAPLPHNFEFCGETI